MLPDKEDSANSVDSDDDNYSYGRGILGRRKLKRTNFSESTQKSPSNHGHSKNGISKDEKALYLHQALSKALPTILSDATSEISLRLGEHRLENLRENIVSQKLRAIVQGWKYDLELRSMWTQRLKVHTIHSEWVKKRVVLKCWTDYFSARSMNRRWHSSVVEKADILAKERIFASWKCVTRQYRRLMWMIERNSFSMVRVFLRAWKDLFHIKRFWRLLVERRRSSRLIAMAKNCLDVMLSAARAGKSFRKTTHLILKCRRYGAYPAYRQWKESVRYSLSLKVSASKIGSNHSYTCVSHHFATWLDGLKWSRRLKANEATLMQLSSNRTALLILAYWNHTVRILRWMRHCSGIVTNRRKWRLKSVVWIMYRSFLKFRKQMILSIDNIIIRQKRNALSQTFHAFYNSMLAHRKRVRALRLRDNLFITRFYGYLLDWASKAKRSRRFQTFSLHMTRTCNKSSASVQNHMYLWKRRASVYWIAWRKMDKLRNRAADKTKALFFASWLRNRKIKCNYSEYRERFRLRIIYCFFFVWADVVDCVLLRLQKIQQGIVRLNSRQQYSVISSAFQYWQLKHDLRREVKNLALKKFELQQQQTFDIVRAMFVWWCHISKLRRDRLLKLSGLDSDREWRAQSSVFLNWQAFANQSKNLERKGTLLENISMKKLLKSGFSTLDHYSYEMQKRRAVFERNATRSEHQICRNHFERWVIFHDQCRLLTTRIHNFVRFKGARHCVRSAFLFWTDKHCRTISYDRCLLQKFLSTRREVFKEWIGLIQGAKAYKAKLAFIVSLEHKKLQLRFFEIWKDWQVHTCSVLTRVDTRQEEFKSHVLARLLVSWFEQTRDASRLRILSSTINNRIEIKRMRTVSLFLNSWKSFSVQSKKQSWVLQNISDRVCKRYLISAVDDWMYVKSTRMALDLTGRVIERRRERIFSTSCFKFWLSVVKEIQAHATFIFALETKRAHKQLRFGLKCFFDWLQMASAQSQRQEDFLQRTRKLVLTKFIKYWYHDLIVFQRWARTLVSNAEVKTSRFLCLTIILHWKAECYKERRLILKIEQWEQKFLKGAFALWVDFAGHTLFHKAKVSQSLRSLQFKTLKSSVVSWSHITEFAKRRRWSLQLFCDKSVTRFCSAAFRGFAAMTALERRTKVVVLNLQRSIQRQKLMQAGHHLLTSTKKSIVLKRQLERGYVKYLCRMVKASWDLWASKLKAKKQTTAVLAKAGAVLIDMM